MSLNNDNHCERCGILHHSQSHICGACSNAVIDQLEAEAKHYKQGLTAINNICENCNSLYDAIVIAHKALRQHDLDMPKHQVEDCEMLQLEEQVTNLDALLVEEVERNNQLESENKQLKADNEHIKDLAMNVFIEMKHAETFISSRDKMHVVGIAQFKDYANRLKNTYQPD